MYHSKVFLGPTPAPFFSFFFSFFAFCVSFSKIFLPFDKVDKTNGCITWGDAEVAAFDQNPYKDGNSERVFIPLHILILNVAIYNQASRWIIHAKKRNLLYFCLLFFRCVPTNVSRQRDRPPDQIFVECLLRL